MSVYALSYEDAMHYTNFNCKICGNTFGKYPKISLYDDEKPVCRDCYNVESSLIVHNDFLKELPFNFWQNAVLRELQVTDSECTECSESEQ